MKKTIITLAVTACFSATTLYANPSALQPKPFKTETVFKVNAFCVSIAKGDLETVKILLARGEDANKKSNGMTPIMYAAKFNRTEILKLLMAEGADLKAKSDKGYTALNYAQMHGAKQAKTVIENALLEKNN
ncbi:MAG: ankyrin repeat domain-containing protein [Flavobacteriaceae bacterium]